jgi:uncharacterized protein (UPF0335 family)
VATKKQSGTQGIYKKSKMSKKEKLRAMIEKDHHIEHIEFDKKGCVKTLKAVHKDIKTVDLTKKRNGALRLGC